MENSKGVNEVCKEWSVREDNALAHQLQQLEVERHYSNNKSRNAIVRSDCVIAKDAQKKAQEEALAEYRREQRDARIAREIAERLENEEKEKLKRLEAEDQRIAKNIQERERRKKLGDVNSVGLPLPPYFDEVHQAPPGLTAYKIPAVDRTPQCYKGSSEEDLSNQNSSVWPPPPQELVDKLSQEKLDEELAKRLQEEEEIMSHLDKDRLLAIEVQDIELAKMLHQKEKARARKVREKAKSKAILKKQMEEEAEAIATPPPPPLLYQNPNLIPLPNIAMAIDPTYTLPEKPNMSNGGGSGFNKHGPPQHLLLHPDILAVEEEIEAPPYMPVKGQKRLSKNKKKDAR